MNKSTTCTAEPVWTSGAVNKWGRFDAFTDYRWECGCGHRYGNATPEAGDVQTQHGAHLAEAAAPESTPASFIATVHAFEYGPGHLSLTSWAAEPWGTLYQLERIATAPLDPCSDERAQVAALVAAHGLRITDEPGRMFGPHEVQFFAYPA